MPSRSPRAWCPTRAAKSCWPTTFPLPHSSTAACWRWATAFTASRPTRSSRPLICPIATPMPTFTAFAANFRRRSRPQMPRPRAPRRHHRRHRARPRRHRRQTPATNWCQYCIGRYLGFRRHHSCVDSIGAAGLHTVLTRTIATEKAASCPRRAQRCRCSELS